MVVAAVVSVGACTPAKKAPPAPAQPHTVEFAFTGFSQAFVVPVGVTQLTLDVYGAQSGGFPVPIVGARGGRATATIAVTPGEALIVNVGGQGSASGLGDGSVGAGGVNGGGTSGPSITFPTCGGGGASDVRRAGWTLADRLVVAGGGGGQGEVTAGGGGGGLVGLMGGDFGGGGGTQTMGGAAGPVLVGSGVTAGSLGTGGTGASAGGGGGGGLYGGGGGGTFGGGGGGSGFGPPGTVFETGVRTGNGLVRITYVL